MAGMNVAAGEPGGLRPQALRTLYASPKQPGIGGHELHLQLNRGARLEGASRARLEVGGKRGNAGETEEHEMSH
jgi:hypothetical protein